MHKSGLHTHLYGTVLLGYPTFYPVAFRDKHVDSSTGTVISVMDVIESFVVKPYLQKRFQKQ